MSEEIIDVDEPTPQDAITEFNPDNVRNLGEPLEITLRIHHPKDTLGGYVVRLIESDAEDGEIHSSLLCGEEYIASNFGTFVEQYLKNKEF